MFDNIIVPKKEPNNFNEPVKPQPATAPVKPLEDIFNDTEKGGSVKSPAENLSRPAGQPLAGAQMNGSKEKKYFLFGLVIFIVILILGGTIWAFNIFFRPATENSAANPNTVVNEEAANTEVNSADLENNLENSPITDSTQNLGSNATASSAPAIEQPQDSDQDGLTDDEENILGTNINMADSDQDGLFDREEVRVYKTNPLNPDTDGDTFTDGEEVKNGYNPNGPGKLYEIK